MTSIYIHYTRDLMLFVSGTYPVILSRYGEDTHDGDRPDFTDWVREQHPDVWKKFIAYMAKRRLTGDG